MDKLPGLIFLSGFMGSGKSTVGQDLARSLDRPFLDLDDAIAEQAGTSIRSVFESRGEETFREMERLCLLDTIREFQGVVALGGGTLQDQHVVDRIKLNGLLIFIETPISVILDRISSDPNRPLLLDEKGKVKDRDILMKELNHLYEQRLPFYEQAEITINSGGYSSVDQLVNELIRKIQYHVSHN